MRSPTSIWLTGHRFVHLSKMGGWLSEIWKNSIKLCLESGFRDMAQRELEESDRGEVWECMKGLMLYCGLESLQCLSLEIYEAGVGDILPISLVWGGWRNQGEIWAWFVVWGLFVKVGLTRIVCNKSRQGLNCNGFLKLCKGVLHWDMNFSRAMWD